MRGLFAPWLHSPLAPVTLVVLVALAASPAAWAGRAEEPAPTPVKGAAKPAAVAEDYVIGVEDVLFVSVWKNPDLSREVPVRPDGRITLPLIDDIQAAGLTTADLKEVLTEKWKSFITAPEVSVIVTQVNSLKVYMVGEILKPGILALKSRTRLLQALSQAGGFTAFADRSRIVVLRSNASGKEGRMEFNYKKILSGSRPEDNIFLMPGDTIIVY